MPAHSTHAGELRPDLELLQALAEDAALLCRLHDREPDGTLLANLGSVPAAEWLSLNLIGTDAQAAFTLLDDFLVKVAPSTLAETLDELAADYADLYLSFAKRVAPNESYWLTEDHIERQEPMFEVRKWYAHYGLKTRNWRKRADDHLVPEMEFVSELLRDASDAGLQDCARFMDEHLLRWSKDFLGGAALHAETPFYAGLALLTQSYLDALRDVLAGITGRGRETPHKALGSEYEKPTPGQPAAFVPGAAPGW